MPDTSGPAFPTVGIDIETKQKYGIDPGVSKRLFLIAHAPPPPAEWIISEMDLHLATEDALRALNRDDKRRDPKRPARKPLPPPDAIELDIRYRMAWADRVLAMNSE